MAIRDLVEIFVSYIQYFLLLTAIRPTPFPWYYAFLPNTLSFINLDLRSLFSRRSGGVFAGLVNDDVPLDLRLQFTVVSVCFPLFLALLALLLLAPKIFILWYTVLLVGIMYTVVGVFTTALKDPLINASLSESVRNIALYLGLGLVVVSVLLAIAYRYFYDARTQQRKKIEQIEKDETRHIDWAGIGFRVLYTVVFIFFGLLFANVVDIPAIWRRGSLGDLAVGLGYALLALAGLLTMWTVVSLFYQGRVLQFKVGIVVRSQFLSILFVTISLVYVAAVSNIFLIVNCTDFQCPKGTLFTEFETAFVPNITRLRYDQNARVVSNYFGYCEPCDFNSPGSSSSLSSSAAPVVSNSSATTAASRCSVAAVAAECSDVHTYNRLWSDNFISCGQLQNYFWPAAGVMLLSFVFSMPIVNFILTNRSTQIILDRFPLDTRQSIGYTDDEVFDEKVYNSDNVAKFIYDPFQMRWKHWRMLFLFQKLFVVAISVFVIRTADVESRQISFGLSIFIHFICFLYILVTRPFKRKVENAVTIVTQLFLTLASIFGGLGTNNVALPDSMMIGFAVASIVCPVLALVLGTLFTIRDKREKDRVREERIREALETVQDEDEEDAKKSK